MYIASTGITKENSMEKIKGEFTGTIGRENMAPKEIWVDDAEAEGGKRPWRFFSVFVDNNQQGTREVVQVTIPNTKRGEKLFKAASAGRRIFVRGRLSHKPKVATNREGKHVAYENTQIKGDELYFLDTPKISQYSNTLGDLVELGTITQEHANNMLQELEAKLNQGSSTEAEFE